MISPHRAIGVAAVLAIVVAGGCAVGPEDEPRAMPAAVEDQALPLGRPAQDGTDASAEVAASIFLVDDDRLRATTRPIPARTDPAARLAAVLDVLISGPTAAEASEGLRSAVPSTTDVLTVDIADETAVVDLSPAFASIGGRRELFAVGQLVLTLTAFPRVQRAEVRLGGRPTGLPLPDGSLTNAPVTMRDYAALLEPDAAPPGTAEGP